MADSKFQLKDVKDSAKRICGKVKETPLEVCTIIKTYTMICCIYTYHYPAITEIREVVRNAKNEYLLEERLSHGRCREVRARFDCGIKLLRQYTYISTAEHGATE